MSSYQSSQLLVLAIGTLLRVCLRPPGKSTNRVSDITPRQKWPPDISLNAKVQTLLRVIGMGNELTSTTYPMDSNHDQHVKDPGDTA